MKINMKLPKFTMLEKVVLLVIVAVLLSLLYKDERRTDFDVRSARVRYEHKICGILVSEKIEETELSRMLATAGIVPDEPRWALESLTTRGLFGVRSHACSHHGRGFFAEKIVAVFRWMDDEYQKTGDEAFFFPEDVKKRVLLYVMECFEDFSRFSSPTEIPWSGSMKECVEFMNRFREEAEEPNP